MTIKKILLIIKKVALIKKDEFVVVALDLSYEIFVIHIISFIINANIGAKVYLLKKAWIIHLKVNETLIKVFNKYTNFADVFSLKLAIKPLKNISINNYTIKLVDDQELLYSLIYSFNLVELEILKTYSKNNLANSFIRVSKYFARIFIFFNKK